MNATATKTLIAVIDGWDSAQGIVYGAVAAERVGVREWNARPVNPRIVPLTLPLDQSFTVAMDARIVAEGFRRAGDWTKHGPLSYSAPIEAHPQRCQTCVDRCECDTGSAGCGHYGCWYATEDIANTCPGVAAVNIC